MTDLDLALVDLGDHLDHPAGDRLPVAVAAAIAVDRVPRTSRTRRRVAAAVVAVLAVGGAVASPAIADWLGLRGVEVHQEPAPAPGRVGVGLDLGRQVTLEEAERVAGFDIPIPAALGEPDEVWVRRNGTRVIASLVWDDPRALLTFIDAGIAEETVVDKFSRQATVIEEVSVEGEPGLWIDGVHEVAFSLDDGDVLVESLRLADRVLLWERGPLTLRLEANLDRDASLRVAESVG